ncbi:MAG: hypothetical protein M0Z52_02040 [Actinomycetota bacterium]|nr:hypothetical protein [Actinomycetota bacterium]
MLAIKGFALGLVLCFLISGYAMADSCIKNCENDKAACTPWCSIGCIGAAKGNGYAACYNACIDKCEENENECVSVCSQNDELQQEYNKAVQQQEAAIKDLEKMKQKALDEIEAQKKHLSSSGHKLMIFGGSDHKTYLGCLNCSEYASDSVLNGYGTYGSGYSSTSVMNEFSEYGSKFSDTSACNEFASHPPIIVDENGNAYGYLTLNSYHNQVRNASIVSWLKGVCSKH